MRARGRGPRTSRVSAFVAAAGIAVGGAAVGGLTLGGLTLGGLTLGGLAGGARALGAQTPRQTRGRPARPPRPAPAASAAREALPARGAEILWDRYGVPHVRAADAPSAARAFGWAQATSHANLILALYGEARGRAAEYWGERALPTDRWVRVNEIPTRARRWLAEQTPAERAQLEAFAAGINAYAAAHPERIADSVRQVLPVHAEDVLAHTMRVLHFEFVVDRDQVESRLPRRRTPAGSNGWAIAPKRTANGRALLVANPHLPWGGFYTWYEAQVTAPGLDASGATLVGMPMLSIAFNDRLGWTHTVNTIDAADLYELTPADGGYRWDGGVRAFETTIDTLRVRRGSGQNVRLDVEPLPIRRSVHGPVVAERDGKLYALRVAGLDRPHILGQYDAMLRARDVKEFEAALARLQMPMFTVIYADRDGHVLHVFNGAVPKRPRGDVAYWAGVVRGDSSATLWTDIHAYTELPRALDPASGWLQNANDPPWSTTLPPAILPQDYPPYMAPLTPPGARPQRSLRMLAGDSALTFERVVQLKHSTRMELADHVLDALLAAVERALAAGAGTSAGATGGEGANAGTNAGTNAGASATGSAAANGSANAGVATARAREAAAVLRAWDRTADGDSRGGVLFEAVWLEYLRRVPPARRYARRWSAADPIATPAGIGDPAAALAALDSAAGLVRARHGRLDVAWGDVHRLRRDALDLPGNGGPGAPHGIFRVVGYVDSTLAGVRRPTAVGGDSYVAVVEFGPAGPRATSLIGYGNASQPGSPHRTDQLALMSAKALKPVWRTRREVEANLERREVVR